MSREGACRCAIGRAYYTAFGHAAHYAEANLAFVPRGNADDHGRLRAHLKQKKRQRTSECLDRLRDWRNSADYKKEFPGDLEAILVAALEDATYVFDSLPPPPSNAP